jgi:hypothetical protein
MIGKFADINSSKTNLLQWSEIKSKQTKSVLKSFLHYQWSGSWSHANGDK